MSSLTTTLTPEFEQRLLRNLDGKWASPDDVLKLSDFYIHQTGQETPWHDPTTLRAYLSYFLPLNVARLRSVWREVQRFMRSEDISEIYDFGSGLGATHWVLEDERWFSPRPLHCLERAKNAIVGHRSLMGVGDCRWSPSFSSNIQPKAGALAVFSYSFLEMQESLPALDKFTHLLVVEPSTRDCGRQLMQWRQIWIAQGYEPLAPCTHSAECPLLAHSGRDWCHMRVAFDAPSWFRDIEENLPMKNRSLTYSYLLLSRHVRDSKWRQATRVIGDTMEERGKTRQMICRGPEREFFSWLAREGPAPRIPHGALVTDLGTFEKKSSELRVQQNLSWLKDQVDS